MTQHPPRHRRIITTALEDWWITTDPLQPFTPDDVAEQVEMYLTTSGYLITPNIPRNRMPTRRAIAAVSLVALAVIASTVGAALNGEWGWSALGFVVTVLLTREGVRDISDRRRGRSAR